MPVIGGAASLAVDAFGLCVRASLLPAAALHVRRTGSLLRRCGRGGAVFRQVADKAILLSATQRTVMMVGGRQELAPMTSTRYCTGGSVVEVVESPRKAHVPKTQIK